MSHLLNVQDEFMISGPGSLGVFVKALGVSDRPPIMWLDSVVGAAYVKPYVVAADSKSLAVFRCDSLNFIFLFALCEKLKAVTD